MSDTHQQSIGYVRDSMLPQATPPASETGAVKWVRQNLFLNIPNSILTLVAIFVLYKLLAGFLPWFLNGVWDAPSIRACSSGPGPSRA